MNKEKDPTKFEPEVFEKVEIINLQNIKKYQVFFSVAVLFFCLSFLSLLTTGEGYIVDERSIMMTNFSSIWGVGFLVSGVLSYYLKQN